MVKKKKNNKNTLKSYDPLFEIPAQAKLSIPKTKAKRLIKTAREQEYPSRLIDRSVAERELKELIHDLKNNKNFLNIIELKLANFWPKDQPAPFLEDLTIKQLVNMPMDDLLDKKSFTEIKFENLIKTLDAFKNSIE